jgi:hypothetical protein
MTLLMLLTAVLLLLAVDMAFCVWIIENSEAL